jgi:hypothetical protein
MAVNGIGVPLPLLPGTNRWRDVIMTHRALLGTEERTNPTWAPTGNDDWWADFFKAQYDTDMNITDGLAGRRNTWNKEWHAIFWGVHGRTLSAVVDDIHNSSYLGLARSAPSCHRATPYIAPKREVKEEPEYATPPVIRRRGSNGITIHEPVR